MKYCRKASFWHEKCIFELEFTRASVRSCAQYTGEKLFRGNNVENTITAKKSIGTIRRKAVDLSHFNPVRESQVSEDQPLPLVMEPAADQVDLAEWARNNRDYINWQAASAWRHSVPRIRRFPRRKISSASRRRFTRRFTPNMATCRAKALPARSIPLLPIQRTRPFCITTRARI